MRRWSPESADSRVGFVPVLAANLLPLGGVFVLGWDPVTLAFIYFVEMLFAILFGGLKALFAQRPPIEDEDGIFRVGNDQLARKCGAVELVEWLPPVYPRNVPFALGIPYYAGFIGLYLIAALSEFVSPFALLADPVVAFSVFALVCVQAAEVGWRFVGQRQYERVSPDTVIEKPVRQTFVLLFAVLGLGTAGETLLLGVVVVVKIVGDWARFRDPEDGFFGWLAGPESEASPEPVAVPDEEPETTITVNRRTVLATGSLRGLVRTTFTLLFVVLVLPVALESSGLTATDPLGIVLTLVLFGTVLPAAVCRYTLQYYLTHGTMAYQRRGETLVAYDTLVESPQWAGDVGQFRNVRLLDGHIADRLYDSRTITLQTVYSDTERRLGHLDEPECAITVFKLPIATTRLEPMNRGVAAVAGCVAAFLVAPATLLMIAPGVPADARPAGAFLLIPGIMLTAIIWKRAYPADPSELAGASE